MLDDTPPRAMARYLELQRRMTPAQRAAATLGMCRGVRRAVIAALEAEHPGLSAEEMRVRLMVRLYGRHEAARVFGAQSVPDDAR